METEPAGIAGATNASTESPSPAKRGKKRVSRQTKKDPKAPKRFKSSYIFYAQTKYKEIERELAEQGITNKVRFPLVENLDSPPSWPSSRSSGRYRDTKVLENLLGQVLNGE